MASQITTLSIFLLLLAFFIALNSMASFETSKSESAMGSLKETFGLKSLADKQEGPDNIKKDAAKTGRSAVLSKIEGLFKDRIQGIEAAMIEDRGQLLLRFQYSELENMIDPSTEEQTGQKQVEKETPKETSFVEALKMLIVQGENEVQYHMTLFINAEKPARIEREKEKKILAVSEIMGTLERKGIPNSLLGFGVQDGKPGTVEALFRPYRPFILSEAEKGR